MAAPKLTKIDEFKEILSDYHVSDQAKDLLNKLKLVLLISPTSAGRNAIINELTKSGAYEYIVSDTTRPKRLNNGKEEQDGVEYYFKSEKEFLNGLKAGEYLEAAIIHEQQVSGISMRELQKAVEHDKIAIDELEIVGADKVINAKPDTSVIFVLPPSYKEWMRRLTSRGDMDQDELFNRLKSAELEYEAALEHDYYKFVINEDLHKAAKKVRDIAEKDKYTEEEHKAALDLTWELLNDVKRVLYS